MNNQNTETKSCYHNYPYVDENPAYYEIVVNSNSFFDGCNEYKCKYCGILYTCDIFTEEGREFEKGYEKLVNLTQ